MSTPPRRLLALLALLLALLAAPAPAAFPAAPGGNPSAVASGCRPRSILCRLAAVVTLQPSVATRYVSPDGADPANTCLDPAAPCRSVARALAVAAPGDVVRLGSGVYREAGLAIDKALTLAGDSGATLDGQGLDGPLLTIAPSGAATIEDLAFRSGAGVRGGALAVEPGGRLVLRRTAVADSAADWGGALYVGGGTVAVEDSTLSGNTAGAGGAVFLAAGTLTLAGVELAGNRAALGGALLVGPGAAATLDRVTFRDNEAAQLGGAIHNQGALTAAGSLWLDNRAGSRGGGLFNDGGAALLEFTTWLGNGAPAGGALAGGGGVRLRRSVLDGSRGGDCALALAGDGNRLDATCGLPALPATDLLPDGRPGPQSNLIDAAGDCALEAGGGPMTSDLRGEPRPADGDRDGRALCDLGAYEFQPRLTIVHNPTLADATRFAFSGDLGDFALAAPAAPRRVFELPPGAYRVVQGREAGWKLTGLACAGDADGGSAVDLTGRAVAIDLDPGELITCVFSSRAAQLTLGVAVESAAPVAVGFSGDLGDFTLSPPDAADRRSGKLAAGLYELRATPPPGWRVEAITCAGDRDLGSSYDFAAGLARLDLDARETLGCVFRVGRVPQGATLTIRHEAAPAEDTAFTYTGDLGPFTLRAPAQPAATFSLAPGVYRVHELLHPLWTLAGLDCDGAARIDPAAATAVVDLAPGASVVCVFRHVRTAPDAGALTIVQTADPAGPAAFAYDGALGNFALAVPDDPVRTWAQLPPGRYAVRQVAAPGWPLASVACAADMDGETTTDPAAAAVVVDVDAGEAITCTFANSRAAGSGRVTIVHEPEPADGEPFRYTGALGGFSLRAPSRPGRTFEGLSPGIYPVSVRLPDGWRLAAISCEGDIDGGTTVDLAAAAAAIDLDPGEAVTCRFRPARDDAPPPPRRLYLPFAAGRPGP